MNCVGEAPGVMFYQQPFCGGWERRGGRPLAGGGSQERRSSCGAYSRGRCREGLASEQWEGAGAGPLNRPKVLCKRRCLSDMMLL